MSDLEPGEVAPNDEAVHGGLSRAALQQFARQVFAGGTPTLDPETLIVSIRAALATVPRPAVDAWADLGPKHDTQMGWIRWMQAAVRALAFAEQVIAEQGP